MNFIFISPNFPRTYWNFCDRLQKRGVNVLAIGDAPYESLSHELKSSIKEYYRVSDMENYDAMYRAVAYFAHHYGRIDFLESNNEYWLEQDARLRTDFNIRTGVGQDGIWAFKSKAEMKKYYAIGGIPTARQHKVWDFDGAKEFISLVGYPVIVKPEVGVGAAATYKLENEEDLKNFFATKPDVPYVMEEFIFGDIYSYDAIVDSEGNPLFESSAHFPPSVMDIVNKQLDMVYYVLKDVPEQLRKRGRATVKAFGVKSRFVHFEFFRLEKGKKGLGRKGDFIGLEVNMRPAGGYTPDMMDYAHSTDVYSIWADMVTSDTRLLPQSEDDHYCLYYGRRDGSAYAHSHEEIWAKSGHRMAMCERIPDVLAPDMGNQMYMLHAMSDEELEQMISFIGERP
ncbi:MAG: ATP-grasp domain-containing protein [Bacteroidales bacterium]|nr:ATP-grasp domain-containing protein [Bacteroidales bacterium]